MGLRKQRNKNYNVRKRKQRPLGDIDYDDFEIYEECGMFEDDFEIMFGCIRDRIKTNKSVFTKRAQVLLTLKFLRSKSRFNTLAREFKVDRKTVSVIIKKVVIILYVGASIPTTLRTYGIHSIFIHGNIYIIKIRLL